MSLRRGFAGIYPASRNVFKMLLVVHPATVTFLKVLFLNPSFLRLKRPLEIIIKSTT